MDGAAVSGLRSARNTHRSDDYGIQVANGIRAGVIVKGITSVKVLGCLDGNGVLKVGNRRTVLGY